MQEHTIAKGWQVQNLSVVNWWKNHHFVFFFQNKTKVCLVSAITHNYHWQPLTKYLVATGTTKQSITQHHWNCHFPQCTDTSNTQRLEHTETPNRQRLPSSNMILWRMTKRTLELPYLFCYKTNVSVIVTDQKQTCIWTSTCFSQQHHTILRDLTKRWPHTLPPCTIVHWRNLQKHGNLQNNVPVGRVHNEETTT